MVNKDEKTKTYCVICSFDNMEETKTTARHNYLAGTGFLAEIFKYLVFRSKYLAFQIQCPKNLVFQNF